MEGMDDILKEFIVETYEGLDQLDRDLVLLEQDPSSEEVLSRVFRTIHTIKGSSGFLALHKLEAITHVGENLLSLLRDQELSLTPDITSALLHMADAVREIIDHVEREQGEGSDDHASLVQTLTRLAQPEATAHVEADATTEASSPTSPTVAPTELDAPPSAGATDPAPAEEPEARASSAVATKPGASNSEPGRTSSVSDSTIRVDVALLDKLMNLVGELVLARNQILQHSVTQEDSSLASTSQRLNLVTTELQEGVMKTRMQPIGNVWSKFPRVVRDLALTCGKNVRVEMDGRDTELDKTILESIKDPLTHAIRNAVDHGIESPEERVSAGKPEQGRLLLRAFHEGGQVNIEISDDGAGIDPQRIARKAVDKGLVLPERAARMTEKELVNLITLPGFSTAEQITNVSGRGVGMDVVRTNIEKIGGGVDIQSKPGAGTTLRIKIPLTLAIIPALIVTSSGDRFAIPQVNLVELVRLEGSQVRKIEWVHGAPVYRLRGTLLPLAYLDEELGRQRRDATPPCQEDEARDNDLVNIVVLQAGDCLFGLVVEGILDTEEIVVKPLGKQLKGVPTFAGAAIMGDGKVALILDVPGLAQNASILGEGRDEPVASSQAGNDSKTNDHETLLLIGNADGTRSALSLSAVDRLEEFAPSKIERSEGREVVQYRGEIMPIVHLSHALGTGGTEPEHDKIRVVVARVQDRSVGIAVHQILDILDDNVSLERDPNGNHRAQPLAIQGQVTDLLDVQDIIGRARPDLLQLTH